ncbi:MAG: flagellar filament capping protein FliD [Pseudomonadota bacterium]
MASITSAGIGSGLDVASLVSQLVAAERGPAQGRISSAQARLNVQLSALGTLKGALADLQAKTKALLDGGALSALKATSSSPDTFEAGATASASAGTYAIEVVSLAQAHRLVSQPHADGSAAVLGNGDVEISVGGASFTVTLTDEANTLGDLRTLINQASDNTGVSATLVNEAGGTRLLLTASEPGTEHQISVASTLLTLSTKQAAADAHIRVEGYDHYAQSNTVSGAIDGVTIDLQAADPGNTHTLSVTPDSDAVGKAVSDFVKSYNAAVNLVGSLTRYDAEKRLAAPLTGDSAVRSTMLALRNVLGSTVAGNALGFLSEIGITSATDGTLSLDSGKLSAVLTDNRAQVEALFAGEDGYATRLAQVLEDVVGDDGRVEAKTESLQARLEDLGRQQEALDLRMERVEVRYLAQFGALDTLLSQMSTTSSYLTQQLEALANLSRRER